MKNNTRVPAPTIVLEGLNESHYTGKLLTCKQTCQLMNNQVIPQSLLDISQVLDISQLSELHNILPGGGLLDGRDFPARDLDEPGVISLLSSSSLRGTSRLGRGWLGQSRGVGQSSLSMPSPVVQPLQVSVGVRPTYSQGEPPRSPAAGVGRGLVSGGTGHSLSSRERGQSLRKGQSSKRGDPGPWS